MNTETITNVGRTDLERRVRDAEAESERLRTELRRATERTER